MTVRTVFVLSALAACSVFAVAQQKPSSSSSSSSTSASKAQSKKPAAPAPPAQANPFPEAESKAAQKKANEAEESQGNGNFSSSHVNLGRFSAGASRDERISNGKGGYVHDPALAKQDDRVGGFYLRTHDYKGAYDRYLEATRVAPENANAVFGLAEAARGLGKTEVAETNYLLYLDALPDGKHAKSARKALKSMEKAHKDKKK